MAAIADAKVRLAFSCNPKKVFAQQPFPGYTTRFVRGRPEFSGYWYSWIERGLEGWLCPALFKYFEAAPEEIYIKVSAQDSVT